MKLPLSTKKMHAYYTEWSQPERERQIGYINIYMKSRRMALVILPAGQKRRDRCKEQTFGLSGRTRGWDNLREWRWNIYTTICKIDSQCESDVWRRAPKASSLWHPEGMRWWGRWEGLQNGGETCIPMANSHWCMAKKKSQYCKVIILN